MLGVHRATLLRTLGRARFIQGNSTGAETAFRASYAEWPHEDAEFFLALSLAGQGRRSEAISHLARVCRTNPELLRLIQDESLRRAMRPV